MNTRLTGATYRLVIARKVDGNRLVAPDGQLRDDSVPVPGHAARAWDQHELAHLMVLADQLSE